MYTYCMKQGKFTLSDFKKLFPEDNACLHHIFTRLYSQLPDFNKYYKVNNRKVYAHSETGHQISPTAGTIFHKSCTSLWNWYYIIFEFANTRNGISAKEVQRKLGVTYKTAWRMCNQIRKLFDDNGQPELSGTVEIDEAYIGGSKANNKRKQSETQTTVLGAVERKGRVLARVTDDLKSSTVTPFVRGKIAIGASIMTDEAPVYSSLKYRNVHGSVNHSKGVYKLDNVHTNTIEGFWSILKNSIDGTFKMVSPRYLQSYINEFSWRYNNRNSEESMFTLLVGRV